MLQRRQSLFLLIAIMVIGFSFLLPVARYTQGDAMYRFTLLGLTTAEGRLVADAELNVPFGLLMGLLAVMLVVIVLQFRDRPRQLRFVRFAYVFVLVIGASLYITHNSIKAYLEQAAPVEAFTGGAALAPVLVLVLLFLAQRGIRKDEELVRSVDRLR